MTSTVALTTTAVRTFRPRRAIAVRTIGARLGTLRAAGGRIGRPVEGAIVSIGAVHPRTLGGRIEKRGRCHRLRSRRGSRPGTAFDTRLAGQLAGRLAACFAARGGRRRRGFPFDTGRSLRGGHIGGYIGDRAARRPTTARARRLVGRSSRRRRWRGLPRRWCRGCVEIRIVVPAGIRGRRGTGAAAANGAFAFGHSKTASGTVGSVPIWKGARRHSGHETM
jgi:hypothetical protein